MASTGTSRMQPHTHTNSSSSAGGLLSLWGLEDDARGGSRQRDHNVIRLITAMAEREAAIMEKATALADKRTAMAERDSALLQRDLAISDRDSASIERDRAMAALNLIRAEQEACPHCHWNRRSAYNTAAGSSKYALMVGVPENIQPLAAIAKTEELFLESAAAPKKKRKRSSKPKEEGKTSRPKKEKKEASLSSPAKPSAKSLHGTLQERNPPGQEKTQKTSTENQLLANGAFHVPLFDCSKIPSPYCSCTGMNEQCYRWGSGGWQSACCTNMISMYPLPMSPKKKGCRVAGRKMSAGAFERLLQRLVAEGWDLNMPVDLKDYWAKHGTNSLGRAFIMAKSFLQLSRSERNLTTIFL